MNTYDEKITKKNPELDDIAEALDATKERINALKEKAKKALLEKGFSMEEIEELIKE